MGNGRRRCWRMRATATRTTLRRWRRAAWTPTGLGPGGPARGCGGRGQASGEGPHGREAGDRAGTGAVRSTQMAVGGAQRVDQGSARLPPIQPARPEQGPGRVGLGVSGIERQAVAGASGSLMTGIPPANQADRRPIQAPVAHPAAPRRPKRPIPGHRCRLIAISRNSPSRKSSYGAGS